MTKFKELLDKVESQLLDEKSERAEEMLRDSLMDVKAAERTLERVRERHQRLLETDVEDVELDSFKY